MFRNFCKAIKIFRSIKQSSICLVVQKKKKNTPKFIAFVTCDAIFMKLGNSLLKTTAILTIGHVIMHTSLYCEDLLCLIYFTA